MARTVILGAGVSGHTAAQHLTRALKGTDHEVVVISPNKQWNWIPSNIWVGTGSMEGKKVVFDLPPVYEKMGAKFHQAKATGIHPEGDGSRGPFVTYERVDAGHEGELGKIEYDYLINATGPRLTFDATPGLGPVGVHQGSRRALRRGTDGAHRRDEDHRATGDPRRRNGPWHVHVRGSRLRVRVQRRS